jgi:hypothetical protein
LRYLPWYPELECNMNREFFFGVLGSLRPEYLSALIKHANRARNKEDEKKPEETILVREDIFDKIESEPFFSSK